ncbi:hypothetical protein Goari_016251 [Gossypium aridum]|uniref:Protein kinase domain-containing protein n=1 Tax=Gossypium aridum TaxID=34290 RepID=A0A7J8WI00_GOSAI|nr:hypothetical protein [Gossypium aridum]
MLFGRRPFGHDQTQERILREDTIIKARKVEFPSRPSVSNEAKICWVQYCTSAVSDFGHHEMPPYGENFWLINDDIILFSNVQDLIRRCLTYNQAERPDVLTIAQDPYLTYSKK